MPNYSNSSIYKLCCNNTEIKNIYIGSTTIFKDRKHKHKYSCNNPNDTHYNQHLYKFIRENNGWDAFDMIEIERYNATDKRNLETRERHWIEVLKPTLNMTIPTRTKHEYDKYYYQVNKEDLILKKKEYYINNRESIIAQNKERYVNNKETLLKQQKARINCICGAITTNHSKSRHI